MKYIETHTPDTFRQRLQIGDVATFLKTGDKYTPGVGWERIPVRAKVLGFGYPFIITSRGRFHYSRFKSDTQLSLKF